MERLRRQLIEIDGRGFKAYKCLSGSYQMPGFVLVVDHVQGDPFAEPSRLCLLVPAETARLPAHLHGTSVRRVALEDRLGREVARAIARHAGSRSPGSGHSGEIRIASGGQQVLQRNAVHVHDRGVEVRLQVGLPARGRSIMGAAAARLLTETLPALVAEALTWERLPAAAVQAHVDSVEDQVHLRRWLAAAGLVAFVADGAVLPRRGGADDRPLDLGAVPFEAPAGLAVTAVLPHRGAVRGLGIPRGVTLIVGGGFHGKSTLLHALERGVYDHVPGDGREAVVSDPHAVKVRAEDGRPVTGIDISPFIDRLPLGRDTREFSTDNASGSTSQAAAIVEAAAGGCRLLLVDEDTSATNFMIRDARMRRLVADDKEPITPLLQRVRGLYDRHGISTVIVMGGSGDYFAVADTVLMMDSYRPGDVTARARSLAGPPPEAAAMPPLVGRRQPLDPLSIDPYRDDPRGRISARGTAGLRYGRDEIDLYRVEQLVDPGQLLAIGHLLRQLAAVRPPADPVAVLQRLLATASANGMDGLMPYRVGTLACPRLHETLATLNRMRGLTLAGTRTVG